MIVPMHVPRFLIDDLTGDWYENPAYRASESFVWGDPYDAFVEEMLILREERAEGESAKGF